VGSALSADGKTEAAAPKTGVTLAL
jgi:hypothetical protein